MRYGILFLAPMRGQTTLSNVASDIRPDNRRFQVHNYAVDGTLKLARIALTAHTGRDGNMREGASARAHVVWPPRRFLFHRVAIAGLPALSAPDFFLWGQLCGVGFTSTTNLGQRPN